MKRAEFVKGFVRSVEEHCHKEVEAKKMRLSEACMGIADAPERGKQVWRKHRKTLSGITAKEFFGSEPKPEPKPKPEPESYHCELCGVELDSGYRCQTCVRDHGEL